VVVDVEVNLDEAESWNYRLEFTQDNQRRAIVKRELVRAPGHIVLDRPSAEDSADPNRLTQTHLEQVNANRDFRPLQEFFARLRYLHIVPQLVRDPTRSVGIAQDPFGGDFLEQIARTPKNTRDSRLRRIAEALRVAVPQLQTIELHRDERGIPHLRGLYEHWRPNAGWQDEDQFSDGTLRLLGLLWALLDGNHPLLLEEPELSLHPGVVRQIPLVMARIARKVDRQIFVSTHSADLLSDEGIVADEVLLLEPTAEDTKLRVAAADSQIRALLSGGVPMAEAVLPRVAPKNAQQLTFFGE
jgi:predicted ATPase